MDKVQVGSSNDTLQVHMKALFFKFVLRIRWNWSIFYYKKIFSENDEKNTINKECEKSILIY